MMARKPSNKRTERRSSARVILIAASLCCAGCAGNSVVIRTEINPRLDRGAINVSLDLPSSLPARFLFDKREEIMSKAFVVDCAKSIKGFGLAMDTVLVSGKGPNKGRSLTPAKIVRVLLAGGPINMKLLRDKVVPGIPQAVDGGGARNTPAIVAGELMNLAIRHGLCQRKTKEGARSELPDLSRLGAQERAKAVSAAQVDAEEMEFLLEEFGIEDIVDDVDDTDDIEALADAAIES